MKRLVFLLVLSPMLVMAQFEMVEPPPSSKKTEFRTSFFQADYIVPNTLMRFLREDPSLVSPRTEYVRVEGRDLYYAKSGRYQSEEEINAELKRNFFTARPEKLKILKEQLPINDQWVEAIGADDILNDFMNHIHYKYSFNIKGRTIFATGPLPTGEAQQSIYRYDFDADNRLLAKRLGRINGFRDTLYWLSTTYEFNAGELQKEVYKKCNEVRCKNGFELNIKIYQKGLLASETVEYYSRVNNELYKEELTNFYYQSGALDSSASNTYYYNKGLREFYEKNFTQYKFDKEGRPASTQKMTWDKGNTLILSLEEGFQYAENKYVYTYKELLKLKRGEKELPLQYELSFQFY